MYDCHSAQRNERLQVTHTQTQTRLHCCFDRKSGCSVAVGECVDSEARRAIPARGWVVAQICIAGVDMVIVMCWRSSTEGDDVAGCGPTSEVAMQC